MKIRPIHPTDATAAVNLIRSTLEGADREHYPTATLEFLIEFFSSDDTLQHAGERFCLVVEGDPGGLVGAVALDGTELVTFIVHPDHMGRGIGQQLLEGIEAEARLRKLERLTFSAGQSMAEFFQRHGYGRTGQMISSRGVTIGLEKSLKA